MFECKAQADEKTEHTNVCEYFEEACNTKIDHQLDPYRNPSRIVSW